MNMRKICILAILSVFLGSCNKTDKGKSLSGKVQLTDTVSKTVTLSAKPYNLKLAEIPEALTVTMTNSTNDTITTGLNYQIEHFQNNKWERISPDLVFHDLGYMIPFGKSKVFDVKLVKNQINYKKGKYRIAKYYLKPDYQTTKENINVYSEFNIE